MEKNENNTNKEQQKRHHGFRVVCRVRPTLARELAHGTVATNTNGANLTILSARAVSLTLSHEKPPFLFQFRQVLPPDTTAQDFFENVAKPAVHELLSGVSNTFLAYGQTGTGKSYTIFGSEDSKGLVPLTGLHLFALINERPAEKFTVTCSYYEIYNEVLTDVLAASSGLRIREDPFKRVYIEGLSEERVTSAAEFDALIKRGSLNRLINYTRMSALSSRAHAIVEVNLRREGGDTHCISSRLTFVDLAGSERTKVTGPTGALREANKLNKSLSSLKSCIVALTSNARHVPYRDSKLTRVLTTSLRDYKATIVLTCSAYHTVLEETLATLRFGKNAYTPHLGAIAIKLRSILSPADRGLFGLLPAELVQIILLHVIEDELSYRQSVWLITQLYERQLPNKPSKELWRDLIMLDE